MKLINAVSLAAVAVCSIGSEAQAFNLNNAINLGGNIINQVKQNRRAEQQQREYDAFWVGTIDPALQLINENYDDDARFCDSVDDLQSIIDNDKEWDWAAMSRGNNRTSRMLTSLNNNKEYCREYRAQFEPKTAPVAERSAQETVKELEKFMEGIGLGGDLARSGAETECNRRTRNGFIANNASAWESCVQQQTRFYGKILGK